MEWKTNHYPYWLSSGKSVGLPGILLQWAPHLDKAVLVVVPTQYAALMLIESFMEVKKWKRWQVQLRTGANKDDDFSEEKTKITVVTYGKLWKWLTSEAAYYHRLLKRYKGFLLDEFAILSASDENGTMQQPQQAECGHIMSRLVRWNPDTTRLIVASATLRQEHVCKCFDEEAGLLATSVRRFALQRFVAAPMKMKNMLNACAELAVAALKRQDGNVIVFLPGLQEILTTQER